MAQPRQLTVVETLQNALYDKGYRRGATYTPRGVLQPVTAFTVYTKAGQFMVLMEYADRSCEVLRSVGHAGDLDQMIAALP